MTTAPPEPHRSALADRWTHRAMLAVLWVLIVAGAAGWLGVTVGEARAAAGDLSVTVTHARVARPGLAAPLTVRVAHPDALPSTVTVAVDADYLALFDTNGLEPTPSESHVDGDAVIWTFHPPADSRVLTVVYDARLQPSLRAGPERGAVSVRANGLGVDVDFSTRILP